MRADQAYTRALGDAGLSEHVEIIDWTTAGPGLEALGHIKRNHDEAEKVAARITELVRRDPGARVILTAHSGGTGVAVWALEDLPADVKIDELLLLASALSTQYDLSAALAHVRRAFNVYSPRDTMILSVGTRAFGTIDRLYADSAGYAGFTEPADADAKQYKKLTQVKYDPAWESLGYYGTHMGVLFARPTRRLLVPLLETGTIPPLTPKGDARN